MPSNTTYYGLVQQDDPGTTTDTNGNSKNTVTLHLSRTSDIVDRVTTRVALVVALVAGVCSVATIAAILLYSE
tara:strand:+ start:645 stop:863 length:219 start_codon:yes stop_codon:yes gene_type:complete